MNTQTNSPLDHQDDAIDLMALAKTIWSSRKSIIKIVLVFMIIGLFIAIFTPKQYTATTTIVPIGQAESVGGSLGGLAALAGINLGDSSSGSEIYPTLYPEVISSIPFQKELLQTPLTIEGQINQISYADYYTNYHTPGILNSIKSLPGYIIGAFSSSPVIDTLARAENTAIVKVSEEEEGLIDQLAAQLSLVVNEKDGFVTISASMPEALAAAELSHRAQQLLQQYIIRFKIQKSTEELEYIKERYTEKENDFRSIQQQLARYRDRNQNLSSAMSQTRLEALTSQYTLAMGVYSELAKQLETQQLQVKKNTPVFTILKPVSVPTIKSSPSRFLILVIWIFMGFVLAIGFVLATPVFVKLKQDFKASA